MRGLAFGLALWATASTAAPPQYLGRPDVGAQPLPFSDAVRVGDTLYLSGQIGMVDGKLPDGIDAQSAAAMNSIGDILKRNGHSMDDIVKCTVMLADMKDWPAFNKVYVTYFKAGRLPARSAFGANGLALGAKVEIECLAWAGH
jgi:reactive intermediate/imine deaminase